MSEFKITKELRDQIIQFIGKGVYPDIKAEVVYTFMNTLINLKELDVKSSSVVKSTSEEVGKI